MNLEIKPLTIFIGDEIPQEIDRECKLSFTHPESASHPRKQAEWLERQTLWINQKTDTRFGILIATYSPYILAHLNTLIVGKTVKQAQSLYCKDKRAFIDAEKVAVYEIRRNGFVDMRDNDYGFRWDTVSDVSAEIQQKFFEVSEKENV